MLGMKLFNLINRVPYFLGSVEKIELKSDLISDKSRRKVE